MTSPLTEEQGHAIEDAVFAGNKINAIKLYREATGEGLKESKDFVDALELDLRRESPERFTKAAGRTGCTGVLLLACGSAIAMTVLAISAARALVS